MNVCLGSSKRNKSFVFYIEYLIPDHLSLFWVIHYFPCPMFLQIHDLCSSCFTPISRTELRNRFSDAFWYIFVAFNLKEERERERERENERDIEIAGMTLWTREPWRTKRHMPMEKYGIYMLCNGTINIKHMEINYWRKSFWILW